ncbi:Crp/Fnr family transcriptional regulator [Pseudobacteriovorax antillogorgiicola]|uniref:cAMP-binding domain of CRP or a regulatory subunit of cAMP-dependent protein kinases n=1 Tax=Pseudobacteriovorax antillogorgiicola TaxID=1513793 RepID=A0A1Y6C5B9_9BACT|nr:cyclic nucleotide-binding domain-containing protein [Pseudobacteriovorax antillogorgiicola]TCS51162.1 CRP-like cAMP-binding protein [Pseudobacteriovorax antillogorgiicola]SMF38126.1 cAMP-binding domain of CRP or a regulatory subunit of cAMP-dependent protein kinases [Pseudobacteriovorax antillogorgiicola]
MAGKNRILEEGTILFKEGDQSNGMYVVRKGKILIYLDKGGNEIPLATVSEGAMIGEMALFDKKPRSASARAVEECEVSVISNADFSKILKQIPKWFVSLMATLSSRLRDTNLRLEDMEAQYKGNINPIEELKKALNIINLLWYKLGTKELKTWSMERELAEKEIAGILGQPEGSIHELCNRLVEGGLLGVTKNSYNKPVFTIQNRGSVERFVNFINAVRKQDNRIKAFPQGVVDMVEVMIRITKTSAYEAMTIPFTELESEGMSMAYRTENWGKVQHIIEGLDEAVAVVPLAEGTVGYKVNKKIAPRLLQHCKLLRAITETNDKRKKRGKAAA